MACDALGNPLPHFALTGGQVHDSKPALSVCRRFPAKQWVADKAYNAVHWRNGIAAMGSEAVTPPKKNTKHPWIYDEAVYKWRHLIENVFQRLKRFHRVATRYEKLKRNYYSMVSLACVRTLI